MKIVVSATDMQKAEWLKKQGAASVWINFTEARGNELNNETGDVFFDLSFDEKMPVFIQTTKPVFVNAVVSTLDQLPLNYIRINAWAGLLERPLIEIAAAEINKPIAEKVMAILNWKFLFVPDVPGMVAVRIISMIINEAYYALGDKVSSKDEIDIAMKLGTNYAYGPFEWGEKIGLEKIFFLLHKLGELDQRYAIAPLLQKEADERISSLH